MTDRELLEMAAKAAGIVGSYSETHPEFGDDWVDPGVWYTDEYDCTTSWNPLANDGDALRLAVTLGFKVEPGRCWCSPYGPAFGEDLLDGEMKAIRRAITRAAAEIGRSMP